MFKEFKEFAFKGNLIDMAVGIIIGGAFGTVVKSLVDNVFMPPLGALTSGVDFSQLKWTIQEGVEGKEAVAATGTAPAQDAVEEVAEVAINIGQFINDFIAFVLVALAVFIVVKKVIGALNKEEKEPEKEPEPSAEEKLLTEIRDLLAKGNS